ncbi:glucosamine--fructose-6-phosphate aminotransferase (isomerizing) [Mesorhizobium sp. J18]|nr:glucosamine--fructose-6-phosphate aminotransferase (isomerizing) [Mesorhizobium sp. J18]
MTTEPTFMRREIEAIPDAVTGFLQGSERLAEGWGIRLRQKDPAFVVTVARGSSDHAASYLKYAFEIAAGIPVASIGPSVASIYNVRLKLKGAACLAISQSGQSPDILRMAQSAREGGALTFALTNTPASPLAEVCDELVDIAAGPERSVAATKTFVNSAVAGLMILAAWARDDGLRNAVHALPEKLRDALACDWSELCEALDGRQSLFILGRGPAFAIANEAALKFKETCAIQAEAYSAAEVMHGPVSIVGKNFPVLALAARDAAERSTGETADRLAGKGAAVFITGDGAKAASRLPFASTGHPLTGPLALIVSFYSFIETLARRRGLDPDRPANLKKVTETE